MECVHTGQLLNSDIFYISQSQMTLPTYLSLFCYEQNLTSLSRSADLTILCAKKRRVSQETSVRITKTTPASLFSTRPSVTSAPAMSSPCQLPRFNTPFYYIYTHLHFLMSCLVTHQKSSNNNSFELSTSAYVIHRIKRNDGWCK